MFRKSLAALIGLTLGMGAASAFTQPAPTVQLGATRKAVRRSLFGTQQAPLARWNYPGAGITMAQQQRAAKKARNVRRHKQSVRGAK